MQNIYVFIKKKKSINKYITYALIILQMHYWFEQMFT